MYQPPLPRYQCHKEVSALKIANITPYNSVKTGCATITPAEEDYHPIFVNHEFMLRHDPKVGGYYVIYKDGYTSYSPAKAFEEGYTLIATTDTVS